MVQEIASKKAELAALCTRYKIGRLWLFGSATDEDQFGPDSDLDFLYETLDDDMSDREYLDFPLKMKAELEALFEREVDFVPWHPFENPYLRKTILQSREILFEDDRSSEKISV